MCDTKKMNDYDMKLLKFLEESGLLIKHISEIFEMKQRKSRKRYD